MDTIVQDIACLHEACHVRGAVTISLVPPPAPCASSQREADRQYLRTLMEGWAMGVPGVMAVIDPATWAPIAAGQSVWDNDGLHFCPRGSVMLGKSLAAHASKLNLAKGSLADHPAHVHGAIRRRASIQKGYPSSDAVTSKVRVASTGASSLKPSRRPLLPCGLSPMRVSTPRRGSAITCT